jgi:hypothetical protein
MLKPFDPYNENEFIISGWRRNRYRNRQDYEGRL